MSMRPLDNGKTKKKRKRSKNKKPKTTNKDGSEKNLAENGPKTKSVISEAINAHKYKPT